MDALQARIMGVLEAFQERPSSVGACPQGGLGMAFIA